MSLSNVPSKVEDNLKKRKNSAVSAVKSQVDIVKDGVTGQVDIVKTGVKSLLNLRPVPAVIDTVVGTIENVSGIVTGSINNVGEAVKDQAEITRDWVGR